MINGDVADTTLVIIPEQEQVKFHGPLPVNVINTGGGTLPVQTPPPPLTTAVGSGLTVTMDTAVEEQPEVVPVTVQVVELTGEAVAVLTPVNAAPADQR